ncbi:MAG: class I SAM-dependent methyltransferase [Alphaproteobacteria bacterium]|nr:class I SAM-dependent methyltransferase [Alphaproteobacteria bacterium]
MSGTASFGYREVPAEEKAGLVQDLFTQVAGRYDLMNDLMSLGIHRLWKAEMVEWLRLRPKDRVVDVAGGTGDIARAALAAGAASVTVVDLTPAMLAEGRARSLDKGSLAGIDWVAGNAEALPLPNRAFDAYTIAFGLRNLTHLDRALAEARRVLKPGGRFVALEFAPRAAAGLNDFFDLYSFSVLPWLGEKIAGDRDAYLYLAESIRRFPDPEVLARKIRAAGFGGHRHRRLSCGIAQLHAATRL